MLLPYTDDGGYEDDGGCDNDGSFSGCGGEERLFSIQANEPSAMDGELIEEEDEMDGNYELIEEEDEMYGDCGAMGMR
ncbi:hypothetical protein LWI28_014941 [Acer negundo]|uniref:Uncharacterized protein n=1 Tax=Acer negundo TaxID=4023 RepID=A0AAD5NRH5_ACENE|nr:hypothetical protein LWI28_014941 [Acer negundo]